MNNIYEKPQSSVQTDGQNTKNPGIILILLLAVFTILAFSASFFSQFLVTGLVASGIGGGIAPLLIGGLVVGMFQMGKRFRNARSRCKIFLWCQVFFFISLLIGLLGQLGQMVKPY